MKKYTDEQIDKKYESLTKKTRKAWDARNRAESMLENLKKNKNLWKQMAEKHGFVESSNIGDWMC